MLALALLAVLAAMCVAGVAFRGTAAANASPTALAPANEVVVPLTVRVTAIPGLMEGDASMDGRTNIVDAMYVAQQTVGMREMDSYELTCADTNDDGQVDIVDAMHIAQFTVDPTGSGGILFTALWEAPQDEGMLDPLNW